MNKRSIYSYFISAQDILDSKHPPLWDFHIHTNYTDGKASVRQVFEKAIEFGLETIIFTDHTEKWRISNANWFEKYCKDIENFKGLHKGTIDAFIGIEANAISFDGEIEMTQTMMRKAEFILGAAHRYPGIEGKRVKDLTPTKAIDLEYRTLMGLAESIHIDAIAHIGATCTKYCTPFPEHLTRKIIRKAVEHNIAIEVNPVYHLPLLRFLELCAEENALITLGSNAHGHNDIGLIVREIKKCFAL